MSGRIIRGEKAAFGVCTDTRMVISHTLTPGLCANKGATVPFPLAVHPVIVRVKLPHLPDNSHKQTPIVCEEKPILPFASPQTTNCTHNRTPTGKRHKHTSTDPLNKKCIHVGVSVAFDLRRERTELTSDELHYFESFPILFTECV